jgi:hypothetical protein
VSGLQAWTARQNAFDVALAWRAGQAAGMELTIENVWFDDCTVWRRATTLSEYCPTRFPTQRLEMLGSGRPRCVGYPQDQGAVWLCVAGGPMLQRCLLPPLPRKSWQL